MPVQLLGLVEEPQPAAGKVRLLGLVEPERPTIPPASPNLSPGPGIASRIQSAMDPQQAINATAKARGAAMMGGEPLSPPSGAPLTNPRMMQIGGGQNTITPSASAGGVVNEPEHTPEGSKTPFYVPERAVAGEYGPVVQNAFRRAQTALDDTRTQRFPWTKIAAETPPEDRAATLMAVAQLSAQKGEFRDMGTLEKMGTGVKRDVQRFKTAVDNTIGDLVGRVFGAKTGMAAGKEATDKRLFERALEGAASTGDPLVDPTDPMLTQWLVGASEMSATMAAGAVTGGALPAMGMWFAPIYDDARDELLEAGVSPDAARLWGAASAAVQSAIETLNLNPFAPKGAKKAAGKGLGAHINRYIIGLAKEAGLEEGSQGATQAVTMAAATWLDDQAPDQGLGDQLKQKIGDALSSAGPLAVMMLPGFIGGLPRSMKESAARRWMVNNPQRVEEIAAKEQPSRTDLPEIKTAAGRAEFAAEVAKAKPRYRYNNQTGKLDPVPGKYDDVIAAYGEMQNARAADEGPHQYGVYGKPSQRPAMGEPTQQPAATQPALRGDEQPWQMTRAQFEATGEDLEHGTSKQFDRFEPGVQDRYGKREVDKFYFTTDPKVSNTFANSGGYRQVAYDQFAETSEAATPEETLAQMRTDLNKSIAKGNVLATIDEATGDLKRVEKAEDVSDDALRDGDVRLYAKNRWPRVIKTKVYGRTLDLFGGDVPEAFKAKFPNWKEFTKEAFPNFSSEFVRGIAQWAAENGYGKVRVRDTYESGYQSIMALPEFIGFNADPHRAFVERAMNQGRDVSPAVLADYPDLAERAAKAPPPAPPAPADIQPPPPGYGRPELANPGATQFARDTVDDIDQKRKEAGVPQVLPNAVVEQRAAELVANDPEGQLTRVLMGTEEPNPEITAVARLLYNDAAIKGMTDTDAFIRAKAIARSIRERRTGVGRELQMGVDEWLTPEERLGGVARTMTEFPPAVQKKYDAAAKPAESRKTRNESADRAIADAWKRLGAAFGGTLGSNAANLPEAAKAAADLAVAYAKKGYYTAKDIIAQIESDMGTKLGEQVRKAIKDAIGASAPDIRNARRENELQSAKTLQTKLSKNEKKVREIVEKHRDKMADYKAWMKSEFGIDLENVDGLTVRETAIAMKQLGPYVSTTTRKLLEWQRFAMLSAIKTWASNTVGNMTSIGIEFGLRYPMQLAIRKAKGERIALEAAAVYRALMSPKQIIQAWNTGKEAFKGEYDVFEVEHRKQPFKGNPETPVDYAGGGLAIKGRKGRIIRIPQRGLLAQDNFAKAYLQRAAVAMAAHQIAVEEGYDHRVEGKEYDARVQELMDDSNSVAWERAMTLIHDVVFQSGDKALDALNAARRTKLGELSQFLIPFVTTPWNLFKYAARLQPGVGTAMLGFDIASKDRQRIIRGASSQILGLAGWALLAAFNRPDDDEAAWRFTGSENAHRKRKGLAGSSAFQPYSLYIGKHRFDLSRLDPIKQWLGVAVDTVEDLKNAQNGDDAARAAHTYATAMARSFRDTPMLQGAEDVVEMVQRLAESAESETAEGTNYGALNAVVEWASKFVVDRTVPNIWKSISRDIDPYKKDARVWGHGAERMGRIADTMRIRAGFDTKDDTLVYDNWGDPISMRDLDEAPTTNVPWRILDTVVRQVSPVYMNQQKPFVGTDLLMSWNMKHPGSAYWPGDPRPDYPDGKGGRIDMTPEQKAQFLRLSGQYAKDRVSKRAAAGRFSPIEKVSERDRDFIKDAIETGRERARGLLSRTWKAGNTISDEEAKRKLRIE